MLKLKLIGGYFSQQKSPGKISESLSAISSKILLLELNFLPPSKIRVVKIKLDWL
jgi:hypothetical protein